MAIPPSVTVQVQGATVRVKGAKGELSYECLPLITVKQEGSDVIVSRADDTPRARERHGLTRAIVANMVHGVSAGYERKLEIIGVGYKAAIKGSQVQLQLGYSHPIDFAIPKGIEIGQEEKNKNILIIRGIDKHLVGQTAAQIRELRPPEPYKGKGIRYTDEVVRRKVGKAAAAKSA